MPEVYMLVTLALIVVLAVVIFKVVSSVIKTVLITGAILAIAGAVLSGVVVMDAFKLKERLQAESVVLVASSDWSRIVSGLEAKVVGGQGTEGLKAFSDDEIQAMDDRFKKKDYAGMAGTVKPGLVIIVNEAAITGSVPESIEIEGNKVPREVVLKQLEESDGRERAMLFAGLLGRKIVQNPMYLIQQYKAGNVRVYPETPVFKAVKALPLSLFARAAKGLFEKAEAGAGTVTGAAIAALDG